MFFIMEEMIYQSNEFMYSRFDTVFFYMQYTSNFIKQF